MLQSQLTQLITEITGQPGQPANPDPVTCAQLSGLLNATNAWLYQISQAIAQASSGGGAPVDLTAVIQQLTALAVFAGLIAPTLNAVGLGVDLGLASIATAIAAAPATDVSGIVAQLKTMADQGDVDQSIFDALQQQGLLTPADLQTLQGIKWSDAVSYITSSAPFRTIMKAAGIVGADVDAIAANLAAKLAPAGNWAESKIIGAAVLERNAIQDVITPILATVTGALKPPGATQLGVINVNPDTVLADVTAVGLNLYIMTALVGLLSAGAGERLAEIVEVATGVLGFEELKEVQIGPLVDEGIRKVAQFQARAKFQQELPGTSTLQSYVAMGLLGQQRAQALSLFNGTSDEMFPISQLAAYRGLNARQMLRLIETDLFSQAEIADELTFSAMRPVSQARMLRAAPYLATAPQRSALIATIESAAVAGLLSDADLTAQVDSAENNEDRDSLILSRVHLQQLVAETKDLETEYTTLFTGGLIDDPTFRSNLATIGLQPFKVNTVAAKAEARSNSTLKRKELAAAAAVARKTAGEEQQAAIKNFMSGNIDLAGLVAALIAAGLTPTQAAAVADLQALRLAGSLRWIYGLQLSPTQAALLRQRVGALTDQRKRLQIDDPTYVAQLRALGIGDRYVNALQAAADALISPKTAAFAVPVKTN